MKPPNKLLLVKIEGQQAVEASGGQENRVFHATYFMTMFEMPVPERILDLESAVVAEKLIAGGDIDVITVNRDATQAPVGTAAFEVDLIGIPVNVLFAFLFLEIDRVDTTMAFALPATSYDRSRN